MTKERIEVEAALRLALEDLKWIKTGMGCKDIDATIQAVEEALANHIPDAKNMAAQPDLDAVCEDLQEKTYHQAMRIAELEAMVAQPSGSVEQEPVASIQHWCTYCQGRNTQNCQFNTQLPMVHTYTTNHTTPPQRPSYVPEARRSDMTWVGLTDEEISELIRATHNTVSFVRAIEAKLKEKNFS